MTLKVHVSEISPVLVELEVTVPWDDFGKRLARRGRAVELAATMIRDDDGRCAMFDGQPRVICR